MEYELFFDESGVFEEPSLYPKGDKKSQRTDKRASQIVGVLAPKNTFTKEKAIKILSSAYENAKLSYNGEVHGVSISKDSLQLILESLLESIELSPFKIVRIVNKEHIGFGNSISTYTNMIAELVIKIFEQLEQEDKGKISLSIIPATRVVPAAKKGNMKGIYEKDYRERLTEYISYTTVRRGLSKNAMNWKINDIKLASARKEPELQICDLFSNTSFNDFYKLNSTLKSKMSLLFGEYDFSLYVSDTFKKVEMLYENGSIGIALNLIIESLSSGSISKDEREKLMPCHKKCVDKLKVLNGPSRNIQLQQIDAWLRQLLTLRKDLSVVIDVIQWVEKFIIPPIANENEEKAKEIEWFQFSIYLHMLTVYNHQGELLKARKYYSLLEAMFPKIAGQWEHAPLMMEGLIHQAVHQTDCFEFKAASKKMRAVAEYYRTLSELFQDALPGYFPERVKSRLRGMALGTCLQNESFAALSEPSLIESARSLSEEALEEFPMEDDKKRQLQYRSQIETFGGNLKEAKHYLAKSIDSDTDDFESLINTISQLPGISQGFALLHCSRIAAEAARQDNRKEVSEFYDALKKSSLSSSDYLNNTTEYPIHGIFRALSITGAYMNDETFTLTYLNKLFSLLSYNQEGKLFPLIILCAWAETAAFLSKNNSSKINKILERNRKKLVKEALKISKQFNEFPELKYITENLHQAIDDWMKSEYSNWTNLIKASRLVGY